MYKDVEGTHVGRDVRACQYDIWRKVSDLIKSGDTTDWGKLFELSKKNDQFELGYKPVNKEVQKTNQKKVRTLQEIFHVAGYRREDHVAAIGEENKEIPNLVCNCLPGATLDNWNSVEIPEMISNSK